MQQRNRFKKLLALTLALALVTVLAACSSGNKEGSSSSAPPSTTAPTEGQSTATGSETPSKEPVTLTIYTTNTMKQYGIQNDPVAKEIEKQTGIKMDFVSAPSDDKFKLMLASGDLPDIIISNSVYSKQLIEGNNIIAMDELLATHGKDILAYPKRVDYSKKYLSNNTGKVYFLPINANATMGSKVAAEFAYAAPLIRWDYYKELNYPEINNEDDLLSVLAEMQKKHPQTEEGKKVYGMAAWTDLGGGLWPYFINHLFYGNLIQGGNVVIDANKNLSSVYMEENSFFWKGFRFWNKAYRMGIVDPDSFTQKFDTARAKGNNGQILFSPFAWVFDSANQNLAGKGKTDAGFMPIYTAFPSVFTNRIDVVGWEQPFISISKKSKHPDRAMDLINFLSTYEGSRLVYSGVQGVHWDLVDGKPELNDDTIAKKLTAPDFMDAEGIGKYNQFVAFSDTALNPKDSLPMDLSKTSKAFAKQVTPLTKSFTDHYGVEFPGQYADRLIQEGKVIGFTNGANLAASSIGVPTDDIKRIDVQVEDYLKANVPKLVMAKTEEDFNKEMKSTIEELKRLGLQQSTDFYMERWKAVLPVIDEFAVE